VPGLARFGERILERLAPVAKPDAVVLADHLLVRRRPPWDQPRRLLDHVTGRQCKDNGKWKKSPHRHCERSEAIQSGNRIAAALRASH
jgi:hypothetical protein